MQLLCKIRIRPLHLIGAVDKVANTVLMLLKPQFQGMRNVSPCILNRLQTIFLLGDFLIVSSYFTNIFCQQPQFDVGAFKVNNYRSWEWLIGYGVENGSKYVPIGLRRNYFKDRAIEDEVHLVPGDLVKVKIKTSAWEVKYVWWERY